MKVEQSLFWLFAKWIKVDLENLITNSRKKARKYKWIKIDFASISITMSPSQTLLDQNLVSPHDPSLPDFELVLTSIFSNRPCNGRGSPSDRVRCKLSMYSFE